jgi:hypothetical protein
MYGTRSILSSLCILLIACAFIAGCANTTPANETAQPAVTQATGTAGPLYGAGDVVKNPKVSSSTAWLVISYDAASDKYERALIYPNSDGSWGYRADSRTEKSDRSVMEKVYTEKITTLALASVPVRTPAIPSSTATVSVTTAVTSSSTTAVTTTATAQSADKPSIKRIIPDKGDAGTSVAVTDLTGNNFLSGASVKLVRSGSADIVATNVRVLGLTTLMCTLPIPSDAPAGTWDLVVTNTDGQSATYTNLFSVHRTTSIVTTTTASTGTIPVTSIDPPFGIAHNNIKYTITGSKFQNGATIKLHNSDKPADIVGTNVVWQEATRLECYFDIPAGSLGNWDIIVTNPDSTTGTKIGGFEIRN